MKAFTKDQSRFVETIIEDETVVMLLDTGDFYTMRETSRAIWQLIDGMRDRGAIVRALAADYGVAPDVIGAEVDAFLAELSATGLLQRS